VHRASGSLGGCRRIRRVAPALLPRYGGRRR
jgi:hypothetical protein